MRFWILLAALQGCFGPFVALSWFTDGQGQPPPPQKKGRDKLLQDGDPDQLLFSWIYLSLVIRTHLQPVVSNIGFAHFL